MSPLRLHHILVALLLCSAAPASGIAQTSISGIVNDYARVVRVETINCRSRLFIDSVASFAAGDRVLVIQTLGCSNPTGYDVAAVGLCEFSTIESMVGTEVRLLFPLVNTYANCGHIQLVRVPVYNGAAVTAELTARPWDGRVGGILVIDVRGTLTFRSDVRADTLGFRGGITWQGGGTCSTLVDDDVFGSPNSAAKGETIVRPFSNMVSGGRGLFGGGGGGRGHNSGGGGGGNGGIGGKGGSQWEGCGSFFDNGGRPGDRLQPVLNGKPLLRFGSGGGAGQMNNNNGTPGGRGGGIVIIRCDTLIPNQRVVSANGGSPSRIGLNDGAGGGGAGGTVMIETRNVLGPLAVIALGGAGGNLNTGSLHGPGGGGGGGCFITSEQITPANISYTLTGGVNGRNTAFADARNSVYLAEGGQPGAVGFRSPVPENRTPPPPIDVQALPDYTVCIGDSIVLDCAITGRADTIVWTTSRGKIVGRAAIVGLRAAVTDTFIVKATGPTGCWDQDTLVITVREPWDLRFDSLDLGVLRCSTPIDTVIELRNRTARSAAVRRWSVGDSSLASVLTVTDTVASRDSFTVRVRISPGDRQGRQSVTVTAVVTPCDSAIVGVISWTRLDRLIDMRPDTVIMPTLETCTVRSEEVFISLQFNGADIIIEDVLTDTVATASLDTPRPMANGDSLMLRVLWSPTRNASTGRLGFVVRDSACLDTLWMTVTGTVKAPFLVAPDTIMADTMTLCEDSVRAAQIPVVADLVTAWTIDSVNITGPGTTDLVRGDTIRGLDTIVVQARPGSAGPYEISLRLRLLPCDTVVSIVVRGVARDAAIRATSRLTYSERFIGRRQILVASYVNAGTTVCTLRVVKTPQAPFRIMRIMPVLPAEIGIGDSVTIEIEYLQTFGVFADSVLLERTEPCATLIRTDLFGQGTAITRVRIPEITVETGRFTGVPVLLDGRPDIDSSLLGTFSLRFAWRTTEATAESGTDRRSRWQVESRGDITITDIVGLWDGSDTLAVIPMRSLLSLSASTDLIFDRNPGFTWLDQPSIVEYDDGVLLINDVCAGRRLRAVGLDGSRPMVHPAPIQDVMSVLLPGAVDGPVTIVISDMLGQAVLWHSTMVIGSADHHRISIGVNGIASGAYIVHIETPDGSADIPAVVD